MEKININDHIGLIIKITTDQWKKNPNIRDNYSLEEMVNENYIKASKIADKYDETRGVKVSTFLAKPLIFNTALFHVRDKEQFRRQFINGKDVFTPIAKDSMNETFSKDGKLLERGDTIPSNYDLEEDIVNKMAINQALDKLAHTNRRIIEEYFYNGLNQNQIAAKLGLSQASVSRILKLSLKELKEEMR